MLIENTRVHETTDVIVDGAVMVKVLEVVESPVAHVNDVALNVRPQTAATPTMVVAVGVAGSAIVTVIC